MTPVAFKSVLMTAGNGCEHQFPLKSMEGLSKYDEVSCMHCNVRATVGEVAWMMLGAHAVRESFDDEMRKRERELKLRLMPCLGGVH